MPTRRELLFGLAATSFPGVFVESSSAPPRREIQIIEEPHCLSEESAKGFRLLLSRNAHAVSPKLIIAPANRNLSHQTALRLLREVETGKLLILESGLPFTVRQEASVQIKVLRDVFGLEIQHPVTIGDAYVEYSWPLRRLVRHFSMIAPVACSPSERMAECCGIPVCAKRSYGRGAIIFLGSMLGPGLLAEETEAHEVGNALLG
jgi:hypothetical protein